MGVFSEDIWLERNQRGCCRVIKGALDGRAPTWNAEMLVNTNWLMGTDIVSWSVPPHIEPLGGLK
jgi:hypothetical protein